MGHIYDLDFVPKYSGYLNTLIEFTRGRVETVGLQVFLACSVSKVSFWKRNYLFSAGTVLITPTLLSYADALKTRSLTNISHFKLLFNYLNMNAGS